jgi:hypothetical protein
VIGIRWCDLSRTVTGMFMEAVFLHLRRVAKRELGRRRSLTERVEVRAWCERPGGSKIS